MDHNNSGEEKCSCGADKKKCASCQDCACKEQTVKIPPKEYCKCQHGMCKDHDPEWENLGKPHITQNPGIFGATTYWFKRCCKKGMVRLKKVQVQKCKKCDRVREFLIVEIAHCECCGYHFEITKPYINKGGINTRPAINRPNIPVGSQPKKPHNKP